MSVATEIGVLDIKQIVKNGRTYNRPASKPFVHSTARVGLQRTLLIYSGDSLLFHE